MLGPILESEHVRLEPPRPDWLPTFVRWFADRVVTRYLLRRYPPSLKQEEECTGAGSAAASCREPHAQPLPRARKNAIEDVISGAEGGSRTHTPLRVHDFESCASASSATSAYPYYN